MRSRGSVPIAESIWAKRAKSIATRFNPPGAASSRHGSDHIVQSSPFHHLV